MYFFLLQCEERHKKPWIHIYIFWLSSQRVLDKFNNRVNKSHDPTVLQSRTFFSDFAKIFRGFGLTRGVAAAVHSTAEHWSTYLSIELHCTYFPCRALHCKI